MGPQVLCAGINWKKKWEFDTGGPIDSSPVIAADGAIYFGSHDKKFYALNPDGTKKWFFETGGAIISSPAIAADGTVYISSVDGKLYALTPEGTKKWQFHTSGTRSSSPVIDADGIIYIGVNDMFWAIRQDGTVLIGGTEGTLRAFGPKGVLKWYCWLGGSITSSLMISSNGIIYLGSNAAKFHAIKGAQGLAGSSWPIFRGNTRQTGRVSNNSKD